MDDHLRSEPDDDPEIPHCQKFEVRKFYLLVFWSASFKILELRVRLLNCELR